MHYAIILQRLFQVTAVTKPGTDKVEPATVGLLSLYKCDGTTATLFHSCHTIENGGTSSEEANKDRRIMPGKYSLSLSFTKVPLPREYAGQGLLVKRMGDSDFAKRRIFLHAGNYPQDTEGCILLQSTYDFTENPGYGKGSMRATKRLYDIIIKKGVQYFTLYIKDEPNALDFAYLK